MNNNMLLRNIFLKKFQSWFNIKEVYNFDVKQVDKDKFSGVGLGVFAEEEVLFFDFEYNMKTGELSTMFFYKDGSYRTTEGRFV